MPNSDTRKAYAITKTEKHRLPRGYQIGFSCLQRLTRDNNSFSFFTAVAVEKQKFIITREAQRVITTTCYADLTRLLNTAPSINVIQGLEASASIVKSNA